jgi:hypothetical protein
VYTADLEALVEKLTSGKMSKNEAAQQLRDMANKMSEPVVNKRAIPGYLPSDKSIYRGVAGLVLLGSPPSAMTLSDSRNMNLPPPIDSNSDRIRISMKRLILVLTRLGLLEKQEGEEDVAAMIKQLWKEASEYVSGEDEGATSRYNGEDVECDSLGDEVELGVLKWVIYGVPANQPSWFSKYFCMPCSKDLPTLPTFPDHPAAKMKQKSGDLVAHDVLSCLLCRNATGCVHLSKDGSKRLTLTLKETESFDDSLQEGGIEMDDLANHLLPKEHS